MPNRERASSALTLTSFQQVTAALSESARHSSQRAFVESGAELTVGYISACPLPLDELKRLTSDDPRVMSYFGGGLTGEVFCLEIDRQRYSIKRRLPAARVANLDGQYSFLTEVQRRADFTHLKQDPATASAFSHIVDTVFASFRHGIMVSPWIEGAPMAELNERTIGQTLDAIVNMELAGLFEWDLCPGNLIDDGERIWLFDFGYCWPFNPLTEFNNNGTRDPLFHGVERFETRNLFAHLLRLEAAGKHQEALETYRIGKAQAVRTGQRKLAELRRLGASGLVQKWQAGLIARWQHALEGQNALQELYVVEGYRSHLLDVLDDLHGRSCTPMTLKRIDAVEALLRDQFALLQRQNGLFFGDEARNQHQLLAAMAERRRLAQRDQL
jgi:hypothetical protein